MNIQLHQFSDVRAYYNKNTNSKFDFYTGEGTG